MHVNAAWQIAWCKQEQLYQRSGMSDEVFPSAVFLRVSEIKLRSSCMHGAICEPRRICAGCHNGLWLDERRAADNSVDLSPSVEVTWRTLWLHSGDVHIDCLLGKTRRTAAQLQHTLVAAGTNRASIAGGRMAAGRGCGGGGGLLSFGVAGSEGG